jgi:hypothetical protein
MTDDVAGETPTTAAESGDDDAYGGVLGAVPYAIRSSDSRLFKSYGVVGGVLAALVAVLFTLSLIRITANTIAATSGVFSFSRAFVIFVGLLVVFPLVAPILSVARRHRRTASTPRYDAIMALTGYAFLVSLWLALVISTPVEQQEPVSGTFAPVVEALYGLPRIAGVVPPTLVGVLLYLVHRRIE